MSGNVTVLAKGALFVRAGATIDGSLLANGAKWIYFENGTGPPSISVGGQMIVSGTTATPIGAPTGPGAGSWGGFDFATRPQVNTVCNVDIGGNLKLVSNRKGFEVGNVHDGSFGCFSPTSVGRSLLAVANSGGIAGLAGTTFAGGSFSVLIGDQVEIDNLLLCVGNHPAAAASAGATASIANGEQCENATTP